MCLYSVHVLLCKLPYVFFPDFHIAKRCTGWWPTGKSITHRSVSFVLCFWFVCSCEKITIDFCKINVASNVAGVPLILFSVKQTYHSMYRHFANGKRIFPTKCHLYNCLFPFVCPLCQCSFSERTKLFYRYTCKLVYLITLPMQIKALALI